MRPQSDFKPNLTMMKVTAVLSVLSLLALKSAAFQPAALGRSPVTTSPTALRISVTDADSAVDIVDKLRRLIEEETMPKFNQEFDDMIQSIFPGAINNKDLETNVVRVLAERGFEPSNTLLATSLCCDELARRLEDDFVKIYGNNFNLGGLSGFPFAGNTGFGAMAAHIPDDGFCLTIFGPHVGVTESGLVGKVERSGIALVDTCCGSAVAASNYLKGITDGGATMTSKIQNFSDFQQGAVQELILPHGKRLTDAKDRMIELPYALFDSQDLLMQDIVKTGSGGIKSGLALLGGIQINTGPKTLDYFHPLRFDYYNSDGEVVADLRSALVGGAGNQDMGASASEDPELLENLFGADPVVD